VSYPRPLLLPNLPIGNLRHSVVEGEMDGFWRNFTEVMSQNSFTWAILVVVCFACILAFVFEATIEIVVIVVALGGLTAVAEFMMHARNNR
jgi:hypothetical protein